MAKKHAEPRLSEGKWTVVNSRRLDLTELKIAGTINLGQEEERKRLEEQAENYLGTTYSQRFPPWYKPAARG